jgi:hypothetical protein
MMQWLKGLLPCQHENLTWPRAMRSHDGQRQTGNYICCVDCGSEFHYCITTMQIGKQIRHRAA